MTSDYVFPQPIIVPLATEGTTTTTVSGLSEGLTKRELFAAMAMQGLIVTTDYPRDLGKSVTEDAVILADRLLAELAEEKAE